jgi:cytochrome P450
VKTLLIAGHETTASAMTWAWLMLARHPAAAARLRAEPDFARAVVNETLRLYPPGWMLPRRSIVDDEIEGRALPAGTDILIAPYLLGRNPQVWQQPEAFRPERFLEEVPRMAHLPFGAGPRLCIGEQMAMAELVGHLKVMAPVLRLREPSSARSVKLEARVNLRPSEDIVLERDS